MLEGRGDLLGLVRFSVEPRTRGHAYKLELPRHNTDVKKRFFGVRNVQRWNSLPSDVVEAGSLEVFKRLLAEHLGDLLYEYD